MALKREEVQDLGRVLGGGLGALLSPPADIPSTDPLLLVLLPAAKPKYGSGGLEGQEAASAMSFSVTYSPCRLAGDFLLRLDPNPVPVPGPDEVKDDDDPAGVTSTTPEPGLRVRRVTVSWFGVEDVWSPKGLVVPPLSEIKSCLEFCPQVALLFLLALPLPLYKLLGRTLANCWTLWLLPLRSWVLEMLLIKCSVWFKMLPSTRFVSL